MNNQWKKQPRRFNVTFTYKAQVRVNIEADNPTKALDKVKKSVTTCGLEDFILFDTTQNECRVIGIEEDYYV